MGFQNFSAALDCALSARKSTERGQRGGVRLRKWFEIVSENGVPVFALANAGTPIESPFDSNHMLFEDCSST